MLNVDVLKARELGGLEEKRYCLILWKSLTLDSGLCCKFTC